MFVISGVNIFPSTIESILFEIEGVEPHYQIVLRRKNGLDSFEVRVEVTEELFDGWQDDLVAFERKIAERAALGAARAAQGEAGRARVARALDGQGAAHRGPARGRGGGAGGGAAARRRLDGRRRERRRA